MREMASGPGRVRPDEESTTTMAWLAGDLGVVAVEEFYELSDRLVGSEAETVILDLHRVYAIDSAGLGALLLLQQRITQAGGTLVLNRPHPNVTDLLDATRLSSEFVIRS